jgi:hypothetical protein
MDYFPEKGWLVDNGYKIKDFNPFPQNNRRWLISTHPSFIWPTYPAISPQWLEKK